MANVCAIFEGEQLIPPVDAKAVIVGYQSAILCTDIIDVFSEPPFEDSSEVMIIRDLEIDETPDQLTPSVSTTALLYKSHVSTCHFITHRSGKC